MPTLSPLPQRASIALGQDWVRSLLAASSGGATQPAADNGLLGNEWSAARQALESSPFPCRREEAWRFTDLSPLTRIQPHPLAAEEGASRLPPSPSPASWRLDLEDRSTFSSLSLPEGVEVLQGPDLQGHLGQVLRDTGADGHWSARLNRAIVPGVLALRIRGRVTTCLELISQAGRRGGVLPLRLLLVLEDGASLTFLQVHRAGGTSLTSVVVEAQLGRDASLRHGLVAQGDAEAALLAVTAVNQSPGSVYSQTSLCSGWALARQEPLILQEDGQASTRLRGLHWLEEHQIADTHSQVRFSGPEGTLDQLHKVVAQGESRSVFNGCVQVPRRAQRTQATQMSRGLLLSERARIDTKPELEIVADDVRCTHGATISRLRDEQLFYLRSRGISAGQASRLLLRGYCQDVMDDLPVAAQAWNPLSFLLDEVRQP
ncbi:MAG: SufD family Fe-S cluster assembly protein [Cyanobacteriota bacterium]|nr:SufD family Fe-S cluster assembly protein [Cyanobacteriota bacterium]